MISSRQIFLAALIACVLELALLLAMAAWNPAPPPPLLEEIPVIEQKEVAEAVVEEEEEVEVVTTVVPVVPVELVVLVPPTPAVEEKLSFQLVDTTATEPSPRPTNLISDQASRAATEEPSANQGSEALPTVTGQDLPGLDLVDQDFQDGEDPAASPGDPAAVAGASSATEPESKPAEPMPVAPKELTQEQPEKTTPETVAARPPDAILPLPIEIPRLTTKRPEDHLQPREPEIKPVENSQVTESVPPRPPPGGGGGESGFQSQKVKRAIEGTLSDRGKASLDVDDTPLGRYMRRVSLTIERDWQRACRVNRDLATPGFLRVNFTIAKDGKVATVRTVEARDGGETSKLFTMNAVRRAVLPPIPPEVVELLENGQLEINFNFLFL